MRTDHKGGWGSIGPVRTLGNILWFVLAGFWLFLLYVLAGLIACVLIITIPFGVASFRIAGFVIWPFGRTAVKKSTAGVGSAIGNIIWFIVAGWWLALGHIVTAIVQFITIIGIPLGLANIKLVPVSLMPLGREIVDVDTVRP